jgi:multidrug efflux pump subunit AcrA (membrane-fusion protein)
LPATVSIGPGITIIAVSQVEIRVQVGGTLTLVFKDGAIVHKGDLLFTIDPEPYEIALAQATAELGVATAISNWLNENWCVPRISKEAMLERLKTVTVAPAASAQHWFRYCPRGVVVIAMSRFDLPR